MASRLTSRTDLPRLRRKSIIPNTALLQNRPGYTRLMSLEQHLRCQKWGARGKASLAVELRPRD